MKKILFLTLFISNFVFSAVDWEADGIYYLNTDVVYISTISSKSPIVLNSDGNIYVFDKESFIVPSSFTIVSVEGQNIIQITTIVVINVDISIPKKLEVEELEVITRGLRSKGKGIYSQDIEISTSTYGLILTSFSGKKYLVWVDDNGTLFTTLISASPEVSYEERVRRIEQKKEKIKQKKKNINKNSTNIQDIIKRLELIEEILNLD